MTYPINNKRRIGIGIVGFTFVVLGFIFAGGGKATIGLPILGVGLVFSVGSVNSCAGAAQLLRWANRPSYDASANAACARGGNLTATKYDSGYK